MKKIISLFLIFALFILSGCNGDFGIGPNDSGIISNEDTVFVIGYNFEGTNPLLVKNDTNREIFSLIYDSLFTVDERYMPYGCLADSVEMTTADGLNYRIDLKNNVTFHDGTLMSAKDVVATINYLLENNTSYDYNVKNILGVSVNTEYSLNVTLKKPTPNFAALLTFPIVNSKDILKEFSFNGTGMFKVDSYVDKKYIDLLVYDNYYKEKNEEIKKIKVQLMPDKETANYAYSSGMSDVFSQDIFTDVDAANPKSGVETKEFQSLNYSFLLLNNENPLFKNVNIRKAIDMAIDKESIVTDVLFSHGKVASTPVFEGTWCYNENIRPSFNIEEAKNILSKEGYIPDVNTGVLKKEDDNSTSLSFDILVNNDNNFRIQVANKISENLKYIGIDCKVRIVSFEEYLDSYNQRTYEAFLGTMPMSCDFDLSLFIGEGNVSNYYSSKAQKTLSDLSLAKDSESKKDYYVELQKIFYYDVPHVSLYYTKETIQSSSKIKKGIKPTAISIFNNIENWSFK